MMDVNIKHDESEDSSTIDRVEFAREVVRSLRDYLSDEPLVVTAVNTNSITVREDDSNVTYNISDNLELELRLLVYVVVASTNYSTPKIIFHFSEDENEDLDITGISVSDFSGVLLSTDDTDFHYSLEVGARYLRNLFKLKGILRFTETLDEKPKELTLISNKSESDNSDLDLSDEDTYEESTFNELFSVFESVDSVSDLRKNALLRGKNQKRLKLMRAKDPAAAKRRSKAAKLRWRQNRGDMIRGIKRFHKSSAGKKLSKLRSQFANTKD